MSGTARKITVEFLGNSRDLERAAKSGEQSTSRLGSKLKTVGKVAGGALAVGAIVAGKALFDMAKNAAADEAAQRKLAIGIKNATGATDAQVAGVEKWISKQGRVLGITDDELRPAFQRLVQATGDVDEAQRQMSIAMDVSAGTGKSLKTVSEALMKANNGTTASLSKLGLKTKDAQGNALTLDEALASMSQTFKGQATASANTFEGKMGRLKIVFDETKEEIGAKLLPMLTTLATWFLAEGLPALSRFGGWIRDNLFPIFERIGAVVKQVMGTMRGDVNGNLGGIRETVANFVSIVRSLWGMFGKDILRYTKATFNNIRTVVKGVLQIIGGIVKVFASVLKGDWRGAWEGVKQILRGAGNVIKGLVSQIFNVVSTLVRAGGRVIVSAVRGIPGMLRGLGGLFLGAGKHLMGQFFAGLKAVGGIAGDLASSIWSGIKGFLNSAISSINNGIPDSISIPGAPDVDLPNNPIPHLAKGGIVKARRGGVLALIGEGGHDEAVVPLSGPHAPRGLGGDNRPIIVQLVVDGKVLHQSLVKRKQDLGRDLGIA